MDKGQFFFDKACMVITSVILINLFCKEIVSYHDHT